MTQFGPRPRRGVLLAFFVALGVLAGHLLSGAAPSVARAASAPLKELSLFTEVYHLITSKYVDTSVLEPRGLIEGAIYGMVDRLADPHTHFLPPEPAEELTIETEGEFSGVGIEINMENGIPTVVSPIEGMPAWEAGLAAGDRIVAVDGEPTEGLSLTEVVKRIRGPVNTPVDLTILRPSLEDSFVVRIVRQVIRVRSVKGTIHDGDLAYIRIVNFTERTPDELDAVWERLRAKNPRGVILDLRSNPGGVLPSAVAVADRFLETGVIVSIRGRDPAMRQTFYASRGPTYPNLPLVVLVNGGSASASEIVTGAVRDHGRGKAIGQKTYGKGSVQSVFPLSDGSKLALTTALYYTPSGVSIHKRGIEPDISIPPDTYTEAERNAVKVLIEEGSIRAFGRTHTTFTREDAERFRKILADSGIAVRLRVVAELLAAEIQRSHSTEEPILFPQVDRPLAAAVAELRKALGEPPSPGATSLWPDTE